ncbi:hypothetical protein K0A97_02705 [Patescibacteria group bacterium]|nr:hypothetical protein [Patescibacteria group bacterium]
MEDYHKLKSASRASITLWLLGASFTFFIFTANISPELFHENGLFSLQITITIPLLLSSAFSRSRQAYSKHPDKWNKYSFFTFILGYGFLINVIGTILGNFGGLKIGLIFFGVNILSDLSYSFVALHEQKKWFKLYKSAFFISILFLGGILPLVGIY